MSQVKGVKVGEEPLNVIVALFCGVFQGGNWGLDTERGTKLSYRIRFALFLG